MMNEKPGRFSLKGETAKKVSDGTTEENDVDEPAFALNGLWWMNVVVHEPAFALDGLWRVNVVVHEPAFALNGLWRVKTRPKVEQGRVW